MVVCLPLLVRYKKFNINYISFFVCVETLQLFADITKDDLKINIFVCLLSLNSSLFGLHIFANFSVNCRLRISLFFFLVCEQFLTVTHSDWVTGKRGRRNSVGSLDSTIEVSVGQEHAASLFLLYLYRCMFWNYSTLFYGIFVSKTLTNHLLSASISKHWYYQKCRCPGCSMFTVYVMV